MAFFTNVENNLIFSSCKISFPIPLLNAYDSIGRIMI